MKNIGLNFKCIVSARLSGCMTYFRLNPECTLETRDIVTLRSDNLVIDVTCRNHVNSPAISRMIVIMRSYA